LNLAFCLNFIDLKQVNPMTWLNIVQLKAIDFKSV